MIKSLIIISAITASLTGCIVTVPVHSGRVEVQPSVEIVYVWDPVRTQYYYVDRGHRYYQHRDWRHPHHGRGRGHRH